MNHTTANAADLRKSLTDHGIKEALWSGFHWTVKMGGQHIRTVDLGSRSFELRIWAEGTGYGWSFKTV